MRTSCIIEPQNQPLIVLKQWQVDLCDGDKCAGLLLSFFIYWHDIKLKMRRKNEQANQIAEAHGDEGVQDTSLLQFHTEEELERGIMGLFKRTKINQSIRLLEKKGFISIHSNPNPKYTFDRTRYFLLHDDVVNEHLHFPIVADPSKSVDRSTAESSRSTENGSRSTENEGTITKTTSLISSLTSSSNNVSTKSPCPKSSDTVLSDTVNQDTNSNNLNSNNVNSNKENTASKKPKEKKELYLDFVRLTLSEYEKLAERLGEEKTKDYIESLNNYIGSKGRRYKSHYHTILAWSRKDETQLKEEPARKIRFMGVDDG